MKKYFKYIAVLLSFVMVFSLSGFAALQTVTNVFADSSDTEEYSGASSDSQSGGDNSDDEQNSDWEYTENEDGTLTITKYNFSKGLIKSLEVPASINGKTVVTIGEKAFENDGYVILRELVIPDGVKVIEKDGLLRSHAYSIILPSTLEKIENIETYQAGSIVYVSKGSYAESLVQKIAEKEDEIVVYHEGNVYETGRYTYAVNDDGTVTILSVSSGSEIPEEIDGKTVTGIERFAFFRNYSNQSGADIVIPESVTFVGAHALNYAINSVTVLNGSAKIEGNIFTGSGTKATIKGLTNSTAEEYAKANNLTFESIGVYEKPTEPESPTEKPSETETTTEAPAEKPSETEIEAPTDKPSESETATPDETKPENPSESEPETTTEAPTEKPTDIPSKPETPIDSDVLDSINSGEKVVTKEVEAGNGSVVPADFVAAAIGKGAQLVLEVKGADGNPVVKYTFDGSRFTKAPDASFKLDVTCGEKNEVTDKVKEQLNVADGESVFLCDFEHSGELNGELAVTVYPQYENGTELKLFYYNEADGKAEDMGQTVRVENGEVTFTVTHFSSYLLVKADDIKNDATPDESEPVTEAPTEKPGETETTTEIPSEKPSEAQTDTTQPETASSQTETQTEQSVTTTAQTESGSYVAPSTGAGAGVPAAAVVGVMLMACGAAGVCFRRKK